MPASEPPQSMIEAMLTYLRDLYERNPLSSSNEAYLQNRIEHHFIFNLGYTLRLGVNYHGAYIQLIRTNAAGRLIGWNPAGSVFGRGQQGKLILRNNGGEETIFPREAGEATQTDTKLQSGPDLADDEYVRIEHKVRGWDGKSRNLDGTQFLKDIVLLQEGEADLLHWSLSEAAYRKWRGEGPNPGARAGLIQFQAVLTLDPDGVNDRNDFNATIPGNFTPRSRIGGGAGPVALAGVVYNFNVDVSVTILRVRAEAASIMPTAEHYVILIRRQ